MRGSKQEAPQDGQDSTPARKPNPTPAPAPDKFTEQMGKISGDDAGHPPAFMFENSGDMIVGKIVGFSQGMDQKFGRGAYPIVNVRAEADGAVHSIHCFHETMISGLNRENVEIGERIAIKRLNDRRNQANTFSYQMFVVKVDRRGSTVKKSFRDAMPDSIVSKANATIRTEGMDAAPASRGADPDDDLPF